MIPDPALRSPRPRRRTQLLALAALLPLVPAAAARAQTEAGYGAGPGSYAPAESAPIDEDASYSYVRTLDGLATLASAGNGPGAEAELNQPLLTGDTVRVARGARVELGLADRTLLRLDGDTTVTLARVAFSADRDDRTTRIELDEGELQLLVGEDALGDELPEIGTPAGTVYVHEPGEYRISFDGARGLEVVVRSGYAELLTERGSTVVRAGESAWTPGDRWSRVELAQAGGYDALERWGAELDRAAEVYDERTLYVEPEYRYAAAPLQRYGSWVYVDSAWAWRPRVTVDWRPYWNGRWAHTPSGLTWVSAEPWGWLPYHYGTWYQAPGFGWCWRPGRVYSPAWVYWYVGPRWTGWCPVGYYTSHYRGYRGNGFRHGLYGWATGSWSFYSDWNFCPTPRVYDRYDRGFRHTGSHIGRLADAEPPRGLLTTDTRGLDRDDWSRGDAVVAKVARRSGHAPERLPVVTDFVARKSVLPPAVEHAVVSERRGGRRVATPLDPIAGGLSREGSRGDDRPAPGWRSRGAGDAGGVVVGIRQPNPTPGERTRTGSGGQGEGGRGPRAEIQPIGEPERDRVVGRPEPRPQPRVEARPGGDADRGGRVEIQPIGEPDRSGSRQGWRQEAKPVERIRIVGRSEPPRSEARPAPGPSGTGFGGGPERARPEPVVQGRPSGEPSDRARSTGGSTGRQGWQQEAPGGRGGSTSGVDSRGRDPQPAPVSRVIGGVRRGAPERPTAVTPSSTRPTTTTVRPAPTGRPVSSASPTSRPSGGSPQASAPGSTSRGSSTVGARGGSSSGSSGSRSQASGSSRGSSQSSSSGDGPPPGKRGGGGRGRDR